MIPEQILNTLIPFSPPGLQAPDPNALESPLPPSSPPKWSSSPLNLTDSDDETTPTIPLPSLASKINAAPRTPRPKQPRTIATPAWGILEPGNLSSSDPGVQLTSPIVGQGKAKEENKRAKARKHRERERAEKNRETAQRGQEAVAATQRLIDEEEATLQERKDAACREALACLERDGLWFGDLLLYVADPASSCGDHRYTNLFSIPGRIEKVLDLWTSYRNNRTGRKSITEWAVQFVTKIVRKEGQAVTRDGMLQTTNVVIDESFATSFSFTDLYDKLTRICPTTNDLLHAFSMTAKQLRENRETSVERKAKLVGSAMLVLLSARSLRNSLTRHVMGLYLYASAAHRQVFTVLSHFGIACSYTTITGPPPSKPTGDKSTLRLENKIDQMGSPGMLGLLGQDSGREVEEDEDDDSDDEDYEEDESSDESNSGSEWSADSGCSADPLVEKVQAAPEKQGGGLLFRLSSACMDAARLAARLKLIAGLYDNINFMNKIAEQILGRRDTQENGTCATIYELFGAAEEDMRTSDLVKNVQSAPPLILDDILLTSAEMATLNTRLSHTILRVIVTFGGDRFQKFKDDVMNQVPWTPAAIPVHKTAVYPLASMNIDEASTAGNAQVVDAIFEQLKMDRQSDAFKRNVRIMCGDQLSISRLRSIINIRAGHEPLNHSYLFAALSPGFFHYQMAFAGGVLEKHWGDSEDWGEDAGSLHFHNNILQRKAITITSPPPYRTCRDLIFVSLYARIFHCLKLVTSYKDLDEYAANITLDELRKHAAQIIETYADPLRAFELSEERVDEEFANIEGQKPTKGDMVHENAILFLRHALMFREFTDSIKDGDSGRIVTIVKWLALAYRGCGRTRYAHETLHLLHNLTHVWGERLRNIIMNNWLVNPTGKPFAWVPADLLQEHMNFWIKVRDSTLISTHVSKPHPTGRFQCIYKAHGTNASWDWLAKVSPCIDILRKLVSHMNSQLGGRQGSSHSTPELSRDITVLMQSLEDKAVYRVEPGRVLHGAAALVPNVSTIGLKALHGPLQGFNDALAKLQFRMRVSPLLTRVDSPQNPNVIIHHTGQTLDDVVMDVDGMSTTDMTNPSNRDSDLDTTQPLGTPVPLDAIQAESSSESEGSESGSSGFGFDEDELDIVDLDSNEVLPLENEEDVELYMD